MAQKYLIVVGDSTTAGGEAVEGDPGWTVECLDGASRPLVRVNNTVICGQCGPTKVVQGATLFFSNSALAAYDGCLLACGHQMVSTKQRLLSVDVADASTPPSRVGSMSGQATRTCATGSTGSPMATLWAYRRMRLRNWSTSRTAERSATTSGKRRPFLINENVSLRSRLASRPSAPALIVSFPTCVESMGRIPRSPNDSQSMTR